MGYEGTSLTELVMRLETATRETGDRLANAMVEHGMRRIRENTPIGMQPVDGSSKQPVKVVHLRDSYQRTPINYESDTRIAASMRYSVYVWTGSVFTEVGYAPFVEHGTGLYGPEHRKYLIKPKTPGGVLAFSPYTRDAKGGVILDVQGNPLKSGGTVFARFVMHPGSPGHHMFQIGSILTEAEYEDWSAEPLRLWKEFVEGVML